MTSLLTSARSLAGQLVETRRDFHRHPELGFEEERTAGLVADRLTALGLAVRRHVGRTGVVGVLTGDRSGPVVALRADMDALPVTEQGDVPYKSVYPGKMHACGHDAHTAMLLGAATLLAARRADLAGQVVFLFQPAEEGPGGAQPMIEDGALDHPRVEAVAGLHVSTDLPVGTVGVRSGPVSASADSFTLTVRGEGGHGAAPHVGVDAIVVAAQLVTGLQMVSSRMTNPRDPVVVTVGTIEGGYRHNIIADRVHMTGTIRTMSPEVRSAVPGQIQRLAAGICHGLGAEYNFQLQPGYPSVINDDGMVSLARDVAVELVGGAAVRDVSPTMGAEDFAYFAGQVPGVFVRLGAGNPARGIVHPGHHPRFDIDEDCLPVGSALLAGIAERFLARGRPGR